MLSRHNKVTYYLKDPAPRPVQDMLMYVQKVVMTTGRGDCHFDAGSGSFIIHLLLLPEDREKCPVLQKHEDEEIWIITNSFGPVGDKGK